MSSQSEEPTQSQTLSALSDPPGSPRQGQSVPHNPHYPPPNPFYFEGKIDYELLQINEPVTPWEYMQRGIHRQDDLDDPEGAIADYQRRSANRVSLRRGFAWASFSSTTIPRKQYACSRKSWPSIPKGWK